jgi:hypothetical protein
MKVKLGVILDAIEMADDNYTYFLDLETGESVFLADERIAEEGLDCMENKILTVSL